MRSRVMAWVLTLMLGAGVGVAAAQDATLLGTVSDDTGGALPGVTVTATGMDTNVASTACAGCRRRATR